MQDNTNFAFLKHHDDYLVRLAQTAEACFAPDPNTTLIKMRQLGEELAKTIAARVGLESHHRSTQLELLRDLDNTLRLDERIKDAFHTLRKLGNPAAHDVTSSNHRDALKALLVGHALAIWFHRTFGGDKAKSFKPAPFEKPRDPSEKVRELEEALLATEKAHKTAQERLAHTEQLKNIESQKAEAEHQRAEEMASESQVWEAIATDQEEALAKNLQQMEVANLERQKRFEALEKQQQAIEIQSIEKSIFELNEAETRVLIDEQLIANGWQADSENMRFGKGARPIANQSRAIAEWPTDTGPADYVLFMGLTPVAIIEAKRGAKDVSGAIDQAKRYARGLQHKDACTIDTNYGEFKVPLTFATNGRPYLEQHKQASGIWFMDIRDPSNRRRALKGWFSPQELKNYLRQTPQQAQSELEQMGFDYNLKLRDYQVSAIRAVEQAIKDDKSVALLGMATGTGKTKTAIALAYRLLKSERFRRILFLVDRSALGVQTSDDFSEVRLENLNTFADTFGVVGMAQSKTTKPTLSDDTKVHVTTVQGLVRRILFAEDNETKPGIGQYDCIIVDECHRGYLLDKELSDTELVFRDQKDYQSKYRSVIEYFDAFKIGLTATPAQHTSEIFGKPVFSYSYTEAVLDGYLNDHEPPVRIHTKLAEEGIKYGVNEPVQVYDAESNSVETHNTPDELNFDVADFNRKVIAPEFTKAVTKWLIEKDQINPYSDAKTLIFCVTDKHADDVVEALKEATEDYYGEVDDDAIQKITGASDKPLEQIRSYKNDRLPNVAVTVDLLTTGIDVPRICNLVFLRRVNSRILFEQMLGRATRLCPEISKGPFHIFDAVDIYKQLENVNTMKPVVTKVSITFSELESELNQSDSPDLLDMARKQFIAKLQVKKNNLTPEQADGFEVIAGKSPSQLAKDLKTLPLDEVAQWFKQHPGLGAVLDAKTTGGGFKPSVILHTGDDEVIDVTTGYGAGQKPEDYLQAFSAFINANSNRMAAIQTVVTKPWALTRQDLKKLAVELEQNQFREKDLQTAWHEVKQEDIAARIIGFIRQAAIGEALMSWDDRVDAALEHMLNSQPWKTPQKDWLKLLAKQTKANIIVDEQALEQGVFKDKQGGLRRANKLFEAPIVDVLAQFNQALWQPQSANL